jgi:hypothetical protein
MKANNKLIAIVSAAVVTLGVAGGVVVWQNNNDNNKSNQNQATTTQVQEQATDNVSYDGVDGKTALALLKENAEVVTKNDPSLGEYVVSINGEDGNGSKYWLYYIDNKASTVGAGEYETKNGEKIEWRLE